MSIVMIWCLPLCREFAPQKIHFLLAAALEIPAGDPQSVVALPEVWEVEERYKDHFHETYKLPLAAGEEEAILTFSAQKCGWTQSIYLTLEFRKEDEARVLRAVRCMGGGDASQDSVPVAVFQHNITAVSDLPRYGHSIATDNIQS
jgi:hypothetical protein